MSLNDTVLDVVRENGPLLPAEIVSEVSKRTGKQTDMFFMGAVLSELMTEKHVKMSHAKIGGSRLYYCNGQEEKLSRVYDYLNSKEKKAYDLLKENEVLRNSEQEPVMRVALFELKDFAKSIDVNLKGTERFWYWYSIPVEDVKSKIKELLKDEITGARAQQAVESRDSSRETSSENREDRENRESLGIRDEKAVNQKVIDEDEPNKKHKDDSKNSFISSGSPNLSSNVKVKPDDEENHFIGSQSLPSSNRKDSREEQSKLNTNLGSDDEFMKQVLDFFSSKEISVVEASLLKKKTDSEFQVYVKSQIGKLRFYVYAKSKKKITETDLGYAYVRSQNVHLPLCFLSDGELTKKASEFMENELYGVTFLKM